MEGKEEASVEGYGGSGEDRAVTLSRHIYPIPAMHLWKSRSQKIFPKMCSVFSKENLPAERRQISFMVRKHPVVIKQAIPARTSEHTRKYNRTSHCLWCPETGGFKLSSKTFDSILFTLLDGSTGDLGPEGG